MSKEKNTKNASAQKVLQPWCASCALKNWKPKSSEKLVVYGKFNEGGLAITLVDYVKTFGTMGLEIGRNHFYAWLRDLGYLEYVSCYNRNLPSEKAIDLGLMVLKRVPTKKQKNGRCLQVWLTQKGQAFITQLLLDTVNSEVQV